MQKHHYLLSTASGAVALGFVALLLFTSLEGFVGIAVVLVVLMGYVVYRLVLQIIDWHRLRAANRKVGRDFSVKLAAVLMGFCLVSGTALYLLAFRMIVGQQFNGDTAVEFNNVEYLMRSLICSLDLFMLDVDSNILDRLDSHPMVKAMISIQAAVSFSCTIALLVSLVFSRAKAYYKLMSKARIDEAHNHLYLFFGLDEPSRYLARDIRLHDPAALIVFVDVMRSSDNESDEWENVVSVFTHRRQAFVLADCIDAYVTIANMQLKDIDLPSDGRLVDTFDILSIRKVGRLIDALRGVANNAQLRVFFLSDSEDDNISNASVLARDLIMAKMAGSDVDCQIYCHARYSGPNRMVEDIAVKRQMHVVVVDSSHIAIDLLRLDESCHPIRVVAQDAEATVSQTLDCLIVGFGEVGRDALRFLYEFGTFVDSSSTENAVRRSPLRLTAIDARMNELEGTFRATAPALTFNQAAGPVAIDLLNMNYRERAFFGELLTPERAATINYVVLAMGDDDSNISLAANIFTYVRRYRADISNLRIMVRCNREDKVEIMRKIAEHYNYGYGKGRGNVEVIRLFGRPEEIYSYRVIIDDELNRLAKRFHEGYCRMRGGDEPSWEARRRKLSAPIGTGDAAVSDIDRLQKLRRQEGQDKANALHAATKHAILRSAIPDEARRRDFLLRYFNFDRTPNCVIAPLPTLGDDDVSVAAPPVAVRIRYPYLTDQENRIVRHMAMLEHLRWNASHEALGYVAAPAGQHGCDERTQKHNCLINWQDIDRESMLATKADPNYPLDYIAYDFSVVDTTLAMLLD